ncbi:MAG: sensor domain-containing diguanylate cyclase [Candidatus Brocadiales bacterium]|nr:sensor domain-containing diguanylate cyclase [Candidatus Brocadiales bacterium]
MKEAVHAGIIAEETLFSNELYKNLSQDVSDLFFASTVVEALEEIKTRKFDIIILSYDMHDFYSIDELITILQESVSIKKIIVFSEKQQVKDELEKKFKIGDERIEMVFGVDVTGFTRTILEIINTLLLKRDAEEQKAKSMEKKNYSENLPLFDSIPIGLYRIDPDGNFMDCNNTLITIFEAPHRDVLLEENYFAMFSDVDETTNWLEIIRKNGIIRGLVFEVEQYNGNSIWVRDNAKSVLDGDGSILYYDGTLEDVTLQKKLEDKLSFLATHDILTGLPNRNFFHAQSKLTLSQARYSGDIVAFLILDIDSFSEIITKYGSKVGDEILQISAERMKELMRKSDLIARLDGDKFIVLLHSIRNRRDILAVAKKVSQVFVEAVSVNDVQIPVTGSIGISIFPEHSDDISTLIKYAEIAALTVKEREKGGYMIYSESIHSSLKQKQQQ